VPRFCDDGRVVVRVSSPVFVGRGGEVARLEAMLERTADVRQPAMVVVSGEAGVGKTRLVTDLIDRSNQRGAIVLSGGCLDVGDGVLPFAPVTEAFRRLAGWLDEGELNRVFGEARAQLTRLLPELGLPDEVTSVPELGAPGRVFELLLGVIHRLAERGPVLVVIEDLQWADRSTRDLLAFLVRNLRAGVLVVLTYRSDDLHRGHPLRAFLAELDRGGRVERIELGRFDERDLSRLLTAILGHQVPHEIAEEIMARSQGNAFFAEELLAARRAGSTMSSELRDLVLSRVEALSEPAQLMLETAAVAGHRVDHDLLADVSQLPPDRLLTLLREAVDHQLLVVQRGPTGDGYAFRHALVREAIYDDLLAVQRVTLHHAYATALAPHLEQATTIDDPGAADAVEWAALAYHWDAARDRRRALVAHVRAGLAADGAGAMAEALRHYERAADLWPQVSAAAAHSPLDRAELWRRAAESAYLIGEADRAISMAGRALSELDPSADPWRTGTLLARLARYHWDVPDPAEAMATIEKAVQVVPRDPATRERATVLATHARLLMLHGHSRDARQRGLEAIAVARDVGARAEEGHALNTLGVAYGFLDEPDLAISHLEQARRVAEEVGTPEELCSVYHNLAFTLSVLGRDAESVVVGLDGGRLARRFGLMRAAGAPTLINVASRLLHLGRWDEADRVLDEVLDLHLPEVNAAMGLLIRALGRLWRGDLDAARADLTVVASMANASKDVHIGTDLCCFLAELETWDGRFPEARTAVAEGMAVATDPTLMPLCLAGIAVEAATAEQARARHATEEAEAAIERAARLRERGRAVADAAGGATPHAAAVLAEIDAQWSCAIGLNDPDQWNRAAIAWEKLPAPFEAACARWHQAEALLAAGTPRHTVAATVTAAWDVAHRLGARLLTAEIESLARRARIQLPTPSTGPAHNDTHAGHPADEFHLTPRERQVLTLVAEGRTNRQIAEKLYISDKTASVHVTNILAKLAVTNRSEAGAVAHRLRLVE
jgi:DNA-binding CsgD family transcriptional regulator/tetratricopeptide (TPR) repeat protein